jgi:hypothetical protein
MLCRHCFSTIQQYKKKKGKIFSNNALLLNAAYMNRRVGDARHITLNKKFCEGLFS